LTTQTDVSKNDDTDDTKQRDNGHKSIGGYLQEGNA